MNEDELRFILESAVRAPSADNRLPIRFRLEGDAIEIRLSEPPPIPGGYRELLLLLTLGAVAENAVIAASRARIRLTVDISPRLRAGEPTLRLVPEDELAETDRLYLQLHRRHTNRRVVFQGPQLSETERHEIEASVAEFSECQLRWIYPPARSFVIRQMARAERERLRSRALHEELFDAIRFDVGWNASCAEGLPPGALQIERPMRPFFTMMRRWRLARIGTFVGAHYMYGLRSCYLPCSLAPDLAAVTVRRLEAPSLIQAGRCFQRIWLELTRLGRALQPLPAGALYGLPAAAQYEGLRKSLQECLEDGWRGLFKDERPVLFFRAGKAPVANVVADRLPIQAYMD